MTYLPMLLVLAILQAPSQIPRKAPAQATNSGAPIAQNGNAKATPAAPPLSLQQPPRSPEAKQAGSDNAKEEEAKPVTITTLPEISVKRDAFDCIYAALDILLVLVGIATFAAIWYQARETAKATRAMERTVIATLKPQLKIPAIAIIPGKLADVNGIVTLQEDANWRIECLIANTGGSVASVVESNLTIRKLGIGSAEGLMPVFPQYSKRRDSFGSLSLQSGERRRETIVLDDTDTKQLRMLQSRQERRGTAGAIAVICFGFLHYMDATETARCTGFAFEYDFETMAFTRMEHSVYDYAD